MGEIAKLFFGIGERDSSKKGEKFKAWFGENVQLIRRGISILGMIAVWWFLAEVGISSELLGFDTARWPTPLAVIEAAYNLLTQHPAEMVKHVGMSLYRVLFGFVLAAIIGVPLGLIIGRSQVVEDLMFPIVETLRPIPPLAWIPVILIVFGTGPTMIFITFIGAFFPIVLNSLLGVRQVKEVEIQAAKNLGADEMKIFKEVVVPKALPSVFTGLSVGMGIGWISIVAAEMIAGNYGLGYFIWSAYNTLKYPQVVVGMILLGVLGYSCSIAVRKLGEKVTPWTEFQGGEE